MALAAAVVAAVLTRWGRSDEGGPVVTVVEPENAACLYQTLGSEDGQLHPVTGDLDTIMAGLACGEPVTVGADVLFHGVDFAVKAPDWVAAQGMRVLSAPVGPERDDAASAPEASEAVTDPRVISGESGAAPFGLVHEALTDPVLSGVAQRLGIGPESTLLFFSTEGDTDREGYEAIVHDGAHARPAR